MAAANRRGGNRLSRRIRPLWSVQTYVLLRISKQNPSLLLKGVLVINL